MNTICGHCMKSVQPGPSRDEFFCPECDWNYRLPSGTEKEKGESVPAGLTVEQRGSEVTIRRRWAWPVGVLALILSAALLLLVMVFTLQTTLTRYTLINVLAGLPITAAALVSLYLGAAFLCNTTRLDLRDDTLVVRHGPVPWPGGLSIDPEDLSKFVKERKVTRTFSGKDEHGRQTNVRYRVRARHRSNQQPDPVLVTGLPERKPARIIVETLQNHLKEV